MPPVLDELRRRLFTQSVGAIGPSTTTTSIFVDSLPEWPKVSIVLMQAQGQEGIIHYGDGVPDIERHRVEMWVRSTAPASGGQVPHSTASKAAATLAYRALVSVTNTTLQASTTAQSNRYLSVTAPNGPPWLFDRDPQGRIYWRCTFDAERAST